MPLWSRDYILDMKGPSHVPVWCPRDIVAAPRQTGRRARYTESPGAVYAGGSRVCLRRRPEATDP